MAHQKTNVEHIRHSLAHILAMAVLERWPTAKLGVGPTIENGFYYDFELPSPAKPEDLPDLEKRMRRIIGKNVDFKGTQVSFQEARKIFHDQPYKLQLIDDLEMYGTTDVHAHEQGQQLTAKSYKLKTVSLYQAGNFIDLCRGGHVANTRELNPDSFRLTKVAGAYWRGSEKNPMLTRIYGVAFHTPKELGAYFETLEKAKQCDHRVLGERLEFFMIDEEVGRGLPLWLPNGYFIRRKLEEYMYALEQKAGYLHVLTPHLAKEELYRKSGHLTHYKDDMYAPLEIENERYYLKPMNCPHHHKIYTWKKRSYRDLPIRIAEFGTVYRYERSGVLSGLTRVRGFTQDDAHIYGTEETLEKEVVSVLKLHQKVYRDLGVTDYWYRLSLPDFKNNAKFGDVQNKKLWERGAAILKKGLVSTKHKYVEAMGEASFYGPKIDIQIKDLYGNEESIATVQIDYYSAPRFKLFYIDSQGKEQPVVVIHHAILGSFDRFFAFFLEKTCGNIPLWLAPVQAVIIPVSDKLNAYAEKVGKILRTSHLRVEVWKQNESVGKKIREGELQKIPYLLIVGDKEKKSKSVSVRARGKGDVGTKGLGKFLESMLSHTSRL